MRTLVCATVHSNQRLFYSLMPKLPHANDRLPGPKVIKNFQCSTQLSTKFIQLVNDKMPTIVGILPFEPVHGISNNVVCATSKASDQPAHTRSLIRAFASRVSIL